MVVASPDEEWVTIAEATQLAGCTGGYLRRLLIAEDERLTGWKAGARAWLIRRSDVIRLREELTTRSVGRREQQKLKRKGRSA
jgi:hypothetical protein